MRRAIDLIHYVVRDGVLNNESNETRTNNGPNPCQRAKEVCVSSFVFWSTSCVSSSRPCCCCGCWAACSFCATTTRPVPSRRGHYFLTLANKQLTSGRHVGWRCPLHLKRSGAALISRWRAGLPCIIAIDLVLYHDPISLIRCHQKCRSHPITLMPTGRLGCLTDGLRSHPAAGWCRRDDPTDTGPVSLPRPDDVSPGRSHRTDAGFHRFGLHVARTPWKHPAAVGQGPIRSQPSHPRRN